MVVESGPIPDYRPLYAERRCIVCGYWRGQHISDDWARDDQTRCPTTFTPSDEMRGAAGV